MRQFSIRTNIALQQEEEYREFLLSLDSTGLIKEFISYLDYTEESDSSRVFNPIQVSSCRVCLTEPLNMLIQRMRSIGSRGNENSSVRHRSERSDTNEDMVHSS